MGAIDNKALEHSLATALSAIKSICTELGFSPEKLCEDPQEVTKKKKITHKRAKQFKGRVGNKTFSWLKDKASEEGTTVNRFVAGLIHEEMLNGAADLSRYAESTTYGRNDWITVTLTNSEYDWLSQNSENLGIPKNDLMNRIISTRIEDDDNGH